MSVIVRQKDIKRLINDGLATDLTSTGYMEMKEIVSCEKGFNTIAVSTGVYGLNGCLLQGCNTKELYGVTARCTNLFAII